MAAPEIPPPGTLLGGKYEVRGVVGDGATGVVLRARMPGVGEVALKLMAEGLEKDEAFARRFEREATALFGLSHPAILRVHDHGRLDSGRSFLVTELLEGETVEQLLARAPLHPDRALALAEALLAGLGYVHDKGMLHRDLKPENLFVDHTGQLKILDFGLVKLGKKPFFGPASVLTQEGAVLGTPGYMAPEQAFGGDVDARADVYAAGAILFELFAGRPVFVGTDPAEVLRAHALEPVPSLASARADLRVRPELDALVRSALAKSPPDRPDSGRMMEEALAAIRRPVATLV
jgi:serine/threonine-protein kinase